MSYKSLVSQRGGATTHLAVYDLKSEDFQWPLNVRATYKKKQIFGIVPPPLIHATRFVGGEISSIVLAFPISLNFQSFSGHGQAKGKLITRIHNNYYSSDIEVVHLELVPWYCRVFIHTLTVTNSRDQNVTIGNATSHNQITST